MRDFDNLSYLFFRGRVRRHPHRKINQKVQRDFIVLFVCFFFSLSRRRSYIYMYAKKRIIIHILYHFIATRVYRHLMYFYVFDCMYTACNTLFLNFYLFDRTRHLSSYCSPVSRTRDVFVLFFFFYSFPNKMLVSILWRSFKTVASFFSPDT